MKSLRPIALVITALVGVLSISVALARSNTPGHVSAAGRPAALPLRHGVFLAPGQVRKSATNGLLDCDMAIYVSDGSTFTSLAAEGHLLLKHAKGKPAGTYSGKFVDNLAGAKAFRASGTSISDSALNGHYVVNTGNGKFRFSIGTKFRSKVPKTYGAGAVIGTILYGAPSYTLHAPLTVNMASFTIGGFMRPVTGTLTLTTDALGYIVPYNAKQKTNSSLAYTQNGKLGQAPIKSLGRYYPPDGAGDGSLTFVVRIGNWTVHVVDALEDTSGQKTISGDAIADSKSGLISQASFTAN